MGVVCRGFVCLGGFWCVCLGVWFCGDILVLFWGIFVCCFCWGGGVWVVSWDFF